MKNGTILIVDKDRFYRELYRDLLSGVGYEVHVHDNSVLADVDVSLFDLIIYEPNRHEDGLNSIFEKAKKLTYKPEVLVITSISMSSVKTLIPDDGIHYTYIKKPFDDSKFLHLVTNIYSPEKAVYGEGKTCEGRDGVSDIA